MSNGKHTKRAASIGRGADVGTSTLQSRLHAIGVQTADLTGLRDEDADIIVTTLEEEYAFTGLAPTQLLPYQSYKTMITAYGYPDTVEEYGLFCMVSDIERKGTYEPIMFFLPQGIENTIHNPDVDEYKNDIERYEAMRESTDDEDFKQRAADLITKMKDANVKYYGIHFMGKDKAERLRNTVRHEVGHLVHFNAIESSRTEPKDCPEVDALVEGLYPRTFYSLLSSYEFFADEYALYRSGEGQQGFAKMIATLL